MQNLCHRYFTKICGFAAVSPGLFDRWAKNARQFPPGMLAVLAGLVLFVIPAKGLSAVELASHVAHYQLKLVSAKQGSSIENVAGDIVVRWERDCRGWAMTNRTVFDVNYGSGQSVRVTVDAATWEALAGDKYTFLVTTRFNDRTADHVEGSARFSDKERVAEFTSPEKKRLVLPSDTMFPVQHTRSVLDAAAKGPGVMRATVFDGFTDGGSQFVNAIFGKPVESDADIAKQFPSFRKKKSWIVNLAYFPGDEAASEPDSEIGTKIAENGVAEWMDMDFGEFRVRGKLEKLQVIDVKPCK